MTRIAELGGLSAGHNLPRGAKHGPRAATPELPADRAELSGLPPLGDAEMQQRISEIRAQIAAGTYITSEKLEHVVTRLLADCTRE